MGVTDEQTECDRCGKLELQRTAIVHDADGAEVGRYGTSCVSQVLGAKWTAVTIDKLEAGRRQRVVTELKAAAAQLANQDPGLAAESLADARSFGIHREDELKRWDELFAQIPLEIYTDRPLFMARLGVTEEPDEYLTVADSFGESVELIPGVIDDEAIHAFTQGQCLALAVALSERTG